MTMHLNFMTRRCPICGRDITRRNYPRHFEACERKHNDERRRCRLERTRAMLAGEQVDPETEAIADGGFDPAGGIPQ